MGLDTNGVKFLLHAKAQGVDFAKTAMIGRHRMHLTAYSLRKNLSDFGYLLRNDEVMHLLKKENRYAEPFLEMLGATEIGSFDAAEYENASYICDFGLPVAESFNDRFTVVLDVGTLEHIFNFPVAIKNCMEMISVGGHFLSVTPANNLFGHGFYQFSPELYFRVFSEVNGFKLVQMILFEDLPNARWFEVADPETVRQRVTLVNTRPTFLAIIAKKVDSVSIFATPPQQSDYVRLWESRDAAPTWGHILGPRLLSKTVYQYKDAIPTFIHSLYRRVWYWRSRFARYHPKFFRRMRARK